MDATTALVLADALLTSGLRIWAAVEGKPAGWVPTAEDFARLKAANSVTSADFEHAPQSFTVPPS